MHHVNRKDKLFSIKYRDIGLIITLSSLASILIVFPFPAFIKIALLTAIIVFILFLINPFVAILTFLLLRPTLDVFSSTTISGIPLSGFFAIPIIAFTIVYALTHRDFSARIPNISLLLLLLPLSLIAIPHVSDGISYIGEYLRLTTIICLYIFIYNLVRNEADGRKVILCIILSILVPVIYGYYQYSWGGWLYLGRYHRLTAFNGQPDSSGVLFSLTLLLTVYMIQQETKRKYKVLLTLYAFLLTGAILLTFHRGSWIALPISFFIIYFFRKIELRYALFALLLVLVFSKQIIPRVVDIFIPTLSIHSVGGLEGRYILWKVGTKLIMQHPLTGSGLGSSNTMLMKMYGSNIPPHNDYLRFAIEIGVTGAIVYLCFLLAEIKYFFNAAQKNKSPLNIFILSMIVYWTITAVAQNNVTSVVTFGILVAALAVTKKSNLLFDKKAITNA